MQQKRTRAARRAQSTIARLAGRGIGGGGGAAALGNNKSSPALVLVVPLGQVEPTHCRRMYGAEDKQTGSVCQHMRDG
eukprot:SAG11_NODE_19468_length_466_cov_0.574932_1_plen_77_part_10